MKTSDESNFQYFYIDGTSILKILARIDTILFYQYNASVKAAFKSKESYLSFNKDLIVNIMNTYKIHDYIFKSLTYNPIVYHESFRNRKIICEAIIVREVMSVMHYLNMKG